MGIVNTILFLSTVGLDECLLSQHNCSAEAECIDIDGGYMCQCKSGYIGDGFICEGQWIFLNREIFFST